MQQDRFPHTSRLGAHTSRLGAHTIRTPITGQQSEAPRQNSERFLQLDETEILQVEKVNSSNHQIVSTYTIIKNKKR